jgi:hypothetical protein
MQISSLQCSTRMLPQEGRRTRMLQRWVTAFPYTLKCHLQDKSDLQRELQVPYLHLLMLSAFVYGEKNTLP